MTKLLALLAILGVASLAVAVVIGLRSAALAQIAYHPARESGWHL
jgi:hypothetical protein